MNIKNLQTILDRYEENYYVINNSVNDEIFKWRATKQFRNIWFSDEFKDKPFSEMFREAKKEFHNIMDNYGISPSNGVVKIAENNGEAVSKLFNEVLFADDGGDLDIRQNNVDLFIEGMNKLSEQYFPKSHMYLQDRHAAYCYLFFYKPQENYIYRYTDAEEFSKCIEFGKDLGSGQDFKLKYYYEMCDLVVKELKKHNSLLEKYFAFLSDKCYKDESLHLLAFDIMFCCKPYGLFNGLEYVSKKESIKAFTEAELRKAEKEAKEAKIATIESEIRGLKDRVNEYAKTTLIGIKIKHIKYGDGVIVGHDVNTIDAEFSDGKKSLSLGQQFSDRFEFDNRDEIIEKMSDYAESLERIEELEQEFERIKSKK